MSPHRPPETRARILTEAMRLFGENGFAATRVADIERAAGLAQGAGGIYRHFRSKAEVLAEGVAWQLTRAEDLHARLEADASSGRSSGDAVAGLVVAALATLDGEGDLNRLIVRDLRLFPDLLEQVRERELRRITEVAGAWFAQKSAAGDDRDWVAVATVLTGAVAHYWLLRDVFVSHPSGVAEPRFVEAVSGIVTGLLADTTDAVTVGGAR
ncbi:TetR/AcrR family transcriptional regulator [Isoptericola sp. BMS4]|uniref:TetR/AcrR family transcriptional regulator n=1 Tax=Isoptericola sp. BMS4 TaxID=2527875 RepID=UPI0014247FE4|nr:TetR family transcriptional regulator [Isoptericola sp. BMS4]